MKDPRSGVAAAPPIPDLRKRARRGKGPAVDNIVEKQIGKLSEWAEKNRRDAMSDKIQYWVFKAPALLCAAGSSILEFYGQHTIVMVLTALATLCIAIDAVRPRGQLHNAHLRAYHDLALLVNEVELEWDQIEATRPPLKEAMFQERIDAIISKIRAETERIATYIKSAEAALGEASHPLLPPSKSHDK